MGSFRRCSATRSTWARSSASAFKSSARAARYAAVSLGKRLSVVTMPALYSFSARQSPAMSSVERVSSSHACFDALHSMENGGGGCVGGRRVRGRRQDHELERVSVRQRGLEWL